ncbi:MAG: 3-methyl-2-oxobutanoate hydroxymethyltransferase [Halobacteriovoraceae bacterium]|jgi:3-methyl-2-oxobutanoate hydroxymethyltransferase|nr:3-methyl-2-oxobutanoate hydroxymethyltransferase [Halobacteriovoraceae bacterium]
MKKLNTRSIRKRKTNPEAKKLQMLTCYDFQTANVLNTTELDLILVGDSVGNVVLGYDTTVEVSLAEMKIFSAAVKRGAPDKFVVADLPFGSYATYTSAIENSISLFQSTKVEALKLEGANEENYKIIKRLTEIGIPVMGHIGLMPQSVHSQGGYYKHGKHLEDKIRLQKEALELEAAGCFAIVLECVEASLAKEITAQINIPTIGIGSGVDCDGQVLVINDLLGMTENKPKFVTPVANLFQVKKELISKYLQ